MGRAMATIPRLLAFLLLCSCPVALSAQTPEEFGRPRETPQKALKGVLESIVKKDYFRLWSLMSIRAPVSFEEDLTLNPWDIWGVRMNLLQVIAKDKPHHTKYGRMAIFENVMRASSSQQLAWVRWVGSQGAVFLEDFPAVVASAKSLGTQAELTIEHEEKVCSFLFIEFEDAWFLDNVHLAGATPWLEKIPTAAEVRRKHIRQDHRNPVEYGGPENKKLVSSGSRPREAGTGYWRDGSSTLHRCMEEILTSVRTRDYFKLYMLCSTRVISSFKYEQLTARWEGDIWGKRSGVGHRFALSHRWFRYRTIAPFEAIMNAPSSPRLAWVPWLQENAPTLRPRFEEKAVEFTNAESDDGLIIVLREQGETCRVRLVKEGGRWFLDGIQYGGAEWPEGDEPVPSPLPPWTELMKPPDERRPADSSSEGRR
jgi:hypothetical protein